MGGVSTFGAFTTARLGIYAAQKALEVTGNNIANINTDGYTRQALLQTALKTGGADRYQTAIFDIRVGGGVLCTGVTQLRDPYLDIRYRNELASVGAMDTKLAGLEDLASILDEVGKGNGDGVIEKQITDLITQIENLVTQGTGRDEYDALVRSSATTLASLFNTYANKLDTITENQIDGLKQDLATVNSILVSIRDLNSSIRRSQIHGGDALELKDQRNMLIDQLSQYMKIDVIYEQEDIGAGMLVEKLVIKLAGTGQGNATEASTLVDGVFSTQFSITQLDSVDGLGNPIKIDSPNFDLSIAALTDVRGNILVESRSLANIQTNNPADLALYASSTIVDNGDGTETLTNYVIETDAFGVPVTDAFGFYNITATSFVRSAAVDLADNDLYGSIQASREMLTEKGQYATAADLAIDPNAMNQRGVPYYRAMLDALANKFANVLNEANKLDDSVIYQTDNMGVFILDANGDKILKDEYAYYNGGNLFSNNGNSDDDTDITAGNISVSQSWQSGAVHMLQSKEPHDVSQTTDNSNLIHMLYLMTADQKYAPSDTAAGTSNTVYFTGGFQKMLTNITATLANDIKTTTAMLENYSTAADSLYVERDAVSGVDLNDEAMGLMQYQKAYAAAARLMTTLDEVLDKLINGTGRAGL